MDQNEREREKKETTAPSSYLVTAIIIIGVVALGLLALNQFIEFRFKAEFLSSPCSLCMKLNPHLDKCLAQESTIIVDQSTGEIVDPYLIDPYPSSP